MYNRNTLATKIFCVASLLFAAACDNKTEETSPPVPPLPIEDVSINVEQPILEETTQEPIAKIFPEPEVMPVEPAMPDMSNADANVMPEDIMPVEPTMPDMNSDANVIPEEIITEDVMPTEMPMPAVMPESEISVDTQMQDDLTMSEEENSQIQEFDENIATQ